MSETLPDEFQRLPVVVCGAGRVGLSLVNGLTAAHWPVAQILLRDESSAGNHRLAKDLAVPLIHIHRWQAQIAPHVLLLAIPDDALAAAAELLQHKFATVPAAGWVALHTSGIHDAAILAPLRTVGMAIGSWHPAQTFPRPDRTLFAGIPITIEGEPAAMTAGYHLALALGARPVNVTPQLKQLFHCLCTISCSHLAALPLFCHSALAAYPAEERRLLWTALLHLSQTTLQNMSDSPDPRSAVTGPVVRGDDRTVSRHVDLLTRQFPHWRPIYEKLNHFLKRILLSR
ncbi:MAG: DUF2520 domain-containing protein [Acidobacteria bacterium]|nr:DUF2520 domain-containing protein [Acidobacteriota bacterium]